MLSYDDCGSDDVTIFWLIFFTHFQNPNYNVQQVRWSITSQIKNWKKTPFLVSFYGRLVELEKNHNYIEQHVPWSPRLLTLKKRMEKNTFFGRTFFFPFLKANCRKRSEGELSYVDCRSDYVTISGNPISNYFFAWGLIDKKEDWE